MRYLHPVQAHEKFVASGRYRFFGDGQELDKSESWVIHEHADGGRLTRVDVDSRRTEGKSILAEALHSGGELLRLNIRYESTQFEGGVKELRASYQVSGSEIQVGYNMNGAERDYIEMKLPPATLIDIPLLVFRGAAIKALAERTDGARAIFVPLYEHAQLFPGRIKLIESAVAFAGEETVGLGNRQLHVRRFQYRNAARTYWIDESDIIIRRSNAYQQREFIVAISNYARTSAKSQTCDRGMAPSRSGF